MIKTQTQDCQSIPERLEILEEYVAGFERTGKKPLAGLTALLIQHQLGSQVRMTEGLIRLGIDPKKIYWVDIPYTANSTVQKELCRLGIPNSHFAVSDYHLGKPYAPYQRKRLQTIFFQLQKELGPKEHLLVLDDGSYFLEALTCYPLPRFKISIVEQTTRGIIKIQNDATLQHYSKRLSIVNVAESDPKKKLESPFIGEAVCESLIRSVNKKLNLKPRDRCLILGYGDIGENVARSLAQRLHLKRKNIHIGEPNQIKRRKAISLGYPIWERDPSEKVRFKLVIGCSGRSSFGIGDRIFLEDGAHLASASSGASELSREEFIDLADGFPHDQIYVKNRKALEKGPIHKDVEIRLVDRDVRFSNGGFPVNFTGEVNCVPPKYIQVTHTLQLGAAVQAVKANVRGLTHLNLPLCTFVTNAFRRMLKKETANSKS